MIANCKNGYRSYEISRATGITQKTAWFMLQRIRLALQGEDGGKLSGEVEVDETFIGGKARNMHKAQARESVTGAGGKDKTVVMGMVERGGKVRTSWSCRSRRKKELQTDSSRTCRSGSASSPMNCCPMMDSKLTTPMRSSTTPSSTFDGNVHTNTMENFWSLLKRGLHGTYISVEPFHLFRYLDEQAFRYNNRKDGNGEPLTDGERFDMAVRQIVGKRLTWAEVTGKVSPTCIN